MKKYIIVILLFLCSLNLFGQYSSQSGYHVITGEVTQLLIWDSHNGLLIGHTSIKDIPDDSITDKKTWVILPNNHQDFKNIYAILLTAKLTNSTVTLYLNKSSTFENYLEVKNVLLK